MMRQPLYQNSTAIVVDAASSGANLPPALRSVGLSVIHVASEGMESNTFAELNSGDFIAEFNYGDLDAVEAFIRARDIDVVCVMAGTESGVPLSEKISARLGVWCNGSPQRARFDKVAMHASLRAAALRTPKTRIVSSADLDVSSFNLPCVIKPANSAGSDSVRVLSSWEDVTAYKALLSSGLNHYGAHIETFVVQEVIAGAEFMVNSISYEGHHKTVEIWSSEKIISNGSPLYDVVKLQHPDAPEVKDMVAFVHRCLDALGVSFGASHCELFVPKSGEMVFIEIGNRLPGGQDPRAILKATGSNMPLWTAALASDPVGTMRRLLPERFCGCWGVTLQNAFSGICSAKPDLTAFRKIKTLVGLRIAVREGVRYHPSSDLFSAAGGCFLVSSSAADLERDYRTIRRMEADNIFNIQE